MTKEEEISQILAKRTQQRKFQKWMKRVWARLPELSSKVFSLKQRDRYLEASLGNITKMLNSDLINFWQGEDGIANQILLELFVEEVFKGLQKRGMLS
jgi:hypothetical protein